MYFFPIKTRPLLPPQDDIFSVIDEYILDIRDGDILFITSKVVAIHQGRCYPINTIHKSDLIRQESDYYLMTDIVPGKDIYLTIRENLLIPSAGIDESNANGHYILLPDHLDNFCQELHSSLQKKFNITNIGIVITDSTTHPLRNGVVGVAIYSYGLFPIRDERGQKDIFGKPLDITQVNIIDALSGSAVYLMGESAECHPFVIGRGVPNLTFSQEISFDMITISPQYDLYRDILIPLLQNPGSRSLQQ